MWLLAGGVTIGSSAAAWAAARAAREWASGTNRPELDAARANFARALEALTQQIPLEDEPDVAELGQPMPEPRRLRHVVAAGRAKFGTSLQKSEANKLIVSKWVREYMMGEHGSPLRMPPCRVAHWEPLVTLAILTPTASAVLATELEKGGVPAQRWRQMDWASEDVSWLDVLSGRNTFAEWWFPAPRPSQYK